MGFQKILNWMPSQEVIYIEYDMILPVSRHRVI